MEFEAEAREESWQKDRIFSIVILLAYSHEVHSHPHRDIHHVGFRVGVIIVGGRLRNIMSDRKRRCSNVQSRSLTSREERISPA